MIGLIYSNILRFRGESYRYGFNGMEKDDENSVGKYDFGARIYDARLGRWLAIDPLVTQYESLTPYCFVANVPIKYIDPDGQKIYDPWSQSAVEVVFDENNKPQFKLENGAEVSIEFLKRSQLTLMSLATTEEGRKLIIELDKIPTQVTIDRLANDPITDDNSTVVPTGGLLKSGHYESVTIIPDYRRIELSAAASNSKFEEVLTSVMSVELGHLKPKQIEIEKNLNNNSPEDFKTMYNGLVNDAIKARVKFREELGIDVTLDVFQVIEGMKKKYPEKAKLLELDEDNKKLKQKLESQIKKEEPKKESKDAKKCYSCTSK